MTGRSGNNQRDGDVCWLEPVDGGWRMVPGFLYRSPRQVALWEAVHRTYAPLYSRQPVRDLFIQGRDCWIHRMKERSFHVLAWASGTGDKEVAFSNDWPIPPISWTAVDISPQLVETSLERARQHLENIPLSGQVLDFFNVSETSVLKEMGDPCLHLLFGVLANQSPQWILRKMGSWMRRGDVLVAGINCLPADSGHERGLIAQQYDNPETREWLGQALREIDVDPDEVSWEWKWEISEEGWGWRLICKVYLKRAGIFRLDGVGIPYQQGDQLEVFSTNRFLSKNLSHWQPPPPLRLVETLQSTCGEEGLLFMERE